VLVGFDRFDRLIEDHLGEPLGARRGFRPGQRKQPKMVALRVEP
jgi:hypothetical protein